MAVNNLERKKNEPNIEESYEHIKAHARKPHRKSGNRRNTRLQATLKLLHVAYPNSNCAYLVVVMVMVMCCSSTMAFVRKAWRQPHQQQMVKFSWIVFNPFNIEYKDFEIAIQKSHMCNHVNWFSSYSMCNMNYIRIVECFTIYTLFCTSARSLR